MDIRKISKKIKGLRSQKGWTQVDLAEKSDVPLTTISKIEVGQIKNPTIEKMLRIADALGVKVDDLIKSN
jgi:transcriptional regulator with XRE-family HTH domain